MPRRKPDRVSQAASPVASDLCQLAVFAVALVIYLVGAHENVFSAGNDASRFAQIESLVDFGSPTIERSRFAKTLDRIVVNGKIYSNKPPVLSIAGAALYVVLQSVTGWRIGGPLEERHRVLKSLTFLLVGVPAALLVSCFYCQLGRFPTLSFPWRLVLTGTLAFGTLVTTFAVTLNNHVPAAALLLIAFIYVIDRRPFAAGVACGIAGTIDLLPGFGLAPFFALMLAGPRLSDWAAVRRFVVGFVPSAVLTVTANWIITGGVMPPKLLSGAVDMSNVAGAVYNMNLPESPIYSLRILFGWHGLFLVTPVLLVGVIGLAMACRRSPFADTWTWRCLAAGFGVEFLGHAIIAGSYGGWSYGFRYLMALEPLLLFVAPVALVHAPARALMLATLPASVVFAWLGAFHPWPPAFEQTVQMDPIAGIVKNPVGANAAAWCLKHRPDSSACNSLARYFITPDRDLQRKYLVVFFGSKGDLETVRRFQ